MLRIAICDDEKIICRQLEDMLLDIGKNANQEIEIDVYYSGEKLCNLLNKGENYDVIFLDIELNQINGVEIGKKIREEFNDESTQIVYISSKESYAMDLFEVRPLNFLIKPLNETKIEATILKAVMLLDKENHYFNYKNSNVTFSVPLKDILYFESHGRKVNIFLNDEIKSFYGKLSSVEEQIDNKDYIMIHKSYLINFNHVIEHTYEYVKMSNQEVLTISQNNRKAVREKLMHRKQRIYNV